MVTRTKKYIKKWLTRMQLCQEASLQALTAVSESTSAEEGWTDINAHWKIL